MNIIYIILMYRSPILQCFAIMNSSLVYSKMSGYYTALLSNAVYPSMRQKHFYDICCIKIGAKIPVWGALARGKSTVRNDFTFTPSVSTAP